MANIYFIQLAGILMTGLGAIVLTTSYYLYGQPLSRDERIRMGKKRGAFRRIPINLEIIVSTVLFLGGMGVLKWSKFNACTFLSYWLPELPDVLRLLLSCR